jgi:hypothetical protein
VRNVYKGGASGISVGLVTCGIIAEDAVRISTPSIVLVLLLLVAIALPALCLAVPAASTCAGAGEMTITPHGDHCPASQPRTCCQMDHGTPMTVPIVRLTTHPEFVSAVITDADDGPIGALARFLTTSEFPPAPAVLRI